MRYKWLSVNTWYHIVLYNFFGSSYIFGLFSKAYSLLILENLSFALFLVIGLERSIVGALFPNLREIGWVVDLIGLTFKSLFPFGLSKTINKELTIIKIS